MLRKVEPRMRLTMILTMVMRVAYVIHPIIAIKYGQFVAICVDLTLK